MANTPHAVERVHPPDVLWKYVVNPVMRRILASGGGRIGNRLMLLHYRGRRSGSRYDVPVGYRDIDGRMAVLTNAGWRVNFRGGHDCELTLKGERRLAHGTLVEQPGEVATVYRSLIGRVGIKNAPRQLGIRINVDRVPTHDELVAAAEREGLSILYLTLKDAV